MKILLIACFALSTLFVNANDKKGKSIASYKTTQSLANEFGDVDNVKWSYAANNMVRADFVIDEQPISAFFDHDGELVASTKELKLEDVSKKLRTSISKALANENIVQVVYMSTKEESHYFIETKTNGIRKVWKCTESGDITLFKSNS